ncbi:MAG: lipopolysaccharide biosynthesis protein [Clostridium perfringens]
MRTKASINNIVFNLGGNLINSLLMFISRTVFINTLGTTYLGLNGLLTNILSMLSLTELGVGTAISFSLYKPIAEKDHKKVISIMAFYKKAYKYIGLLVFISGLIVMPFLKYIIKDYNLIDKLYAIYLLYLVNTAYTYLFTYKRTLITADQKGYKLVPFTTVFKIITIVLQIIVLILTKSFIIYLVIQLITSLFENIVVNIYIDKKYPILNNKSEKIDEHELKVIVKNIKAMMFHKIGDFCINSTDNMIISAFISVTVVGIYSNYLMIINMINQFVMIFFNSLTASLGNLIAQEGKEKNFKIFNIIDFIGFWIYGFVTVCFYNLMNPFITLWVGPQNLLSKEIVIVVILNYYLTGMRVSVSTIKGAAGLYDDDKYIPIIQSVINLVISLVLVKKIGLMGVFVGTLISSVVLPCWYRPMLIYKKIFKESQIKYFVKYFKYLFIVVINVLVTSTLINLTCSTLNIFTFIIMVLISGLVPNIIIILIFWKSEEFKYLLDTATNILRRNLNG